MIDSLDKIYNPEFAGYFMAQAPFKKRIYSLVVEHTLNPDSTPCVGTGKTEEPKKSRSDHSSLHIFIS